MSRIAGDDPRGTYQARLPNPVETAEAHHSKHLLLFEATDNDDRSGQCDHRTRLPLDEVFALDVTAPSDALGTLHCGECRADADCQSGYCVQLDGGTRCLDGCMGTGALNCAHVSEAGCCLGNVLTYCEDGQVTQLSCTDSLACGWNVARELYVCQAEASEDPAGVSPRTCDGAAAPRARAVRS